MNNAIKQEADGASNMTDNMSAVSAVAPAGLLDPMESLLDLSEYETAQQQFNSPSMSPTSSKTPFVRTTNAAPTAPLLTSNQQMTGPSHQYDLYKQQTGFAPGALANTYAVNQNTQMAAGFQNFEMGFLNIPNGDDLFDFNTPPNNNNSVSPSDIELDFESPAADATFFYPDSATATSAAISPAVVASQDSSMMSQSQPMLGSNTTSQNGNVGRLWPGMHQQAALAKAQAQQRQQQQIIQQQQRQRQSVGQPQPQQIAKPTQPQQRSKSAQPSDPIVEQKITQLLNSMRAKPSSPNGGPNSPMVNVSRPKKDEEDMDDDERLLASEEGKKLTSKERRQLRNKVSARAFRSRRKEYISQLEAEIATKVTENGDLRTQNRALAEENKRLSDLTRMLLGSPSFSDFLDRLSANPALLPHQQQPQQAHPSQSAQAAPAQAPQVEQHQAPKDVNPYAAQQQIGMAMIPEQNFDFSMLQIDNEPSFSFQPQVYAVLETPEVPISIDTSILTGKTSNFVGAAFDAEEEKIDMPVIAHPVTEEKKEAVKVVVLDAEFESNPAFALYHESTSTTSVAPAEAMSESCKPIELNTEVMSDVDIFGGIETEKALSRLELVDVSEEAVGEVKNSMAVARINLIASNLKAIEARLSMLSFDV